MTQPDDTCPGCGGAGYVRCKAPCVDATVAKPCPTCNGTGRRLTERERQLRESVREWT